MDINTSWSPKEVLEFGIFRKEGQQLKYIVKGSTHIPSILHAIPLGVLNGLAKLALKTPEYQSKRIGSIYHDHANTLREAHLVPSIFRAMEKIMVTSG